MEAPLGVLAGLGNPSIARPAIVFTATAVAAGVVVTFLPAALTPAGSDLAALALLVQAAAATLTRWLAGRHADRHGTAGLLLSGVLAVSAGMLCLVLSPSAAWVLVGMVLFGVGFGVAQSASLTQMFERVPASGYGTVSAVWNMAYDIGWGAGAAGIGLVVSNSGYSTAFAVTAALTTRRLAPGQEQGSPRSWTSHCLRRQPVAGSSTARSSISRAWRAASSSG